VRRGKEIQIAAGNMFERHNLNHISLTIRVLDTAALFARGMGYERATDADLKSARPIATARFNSHRRKCSTCQTAWPDVTDIK
jgi:hypothetical protein